MEVDKTTVKKYLSLSLIILFAIFLLYLLRQFITPFLGAIIFYVLFKPMMLKLVEKYNWKTNWAVIVIILLSFTIILIPILSLSYMLYAKIAEVISDPSSMLNIVNIASDKILALTGVDILNKENIAVFKQNAGNLIPSFLNQFLWILGNIGVMYFILYYLLMNSKQVTLETNRILPFNPENIKILNTELESMTMSNVIGVPTIGIIQGAFAALGYWIFGIKEPVFWGVITAFVSLIPLVGSTLIWIPAAIFLLAMGNTWQGISLLAYGAIIIINIDNVARLFIQKKFADVHPVITIFGVLIGINLFGLPGLIFGPLMLSYFVIFIRMYRKIYSNNTLTD